MFANITNDSVDITTTDFPLEPVAVENAVMPDGRPVVLLAVTKAAVREGTLNGAPAYVLMITDDSIAARGSGLGARLTDALATLKPAAT